MATTTYWTDRYTRLKRLRGAQEDRAEQHPFIGIPALGLRVGDSIIWGDRVLEVEHLPLGDSDASWRIFHTVASDDGQRVLLDLMPMEEVHVLLPRPSAAEQKDHP